MIIVSETCSAFDVCCYDFAHSLGAECPTIDWYFYNGYCYYPSTTSANYRSAYFSCQAMGANLASISDQNEMDFVLKISYEPTIVILI